MGGPLNAEVWRAANTEKVRHLAAERLGSWSSSAEKLDHSLEVMECFPVFDVNADLLVAGTSEELIDALRFTGRWHVQVSREGRPHGFARVVEAMDELSVERWSRDDLCLRLNDALAVADAAAMGNDVVAVLVEAPVFGMSAILLLRDESEPRAILLRLGRAKYSGMALIKPLQDLLDDAKRWKVLRGVVHA